MLARKYYEGNSCLKPKYKTMSAIIILCTESMWFFAQTLILWLIADFITGVIHWWEDAYGNPNWPIIGKYIIEPNLEHHRSPRLLLQGSYWNRINTSVYAAVMIILALWICGVFYWQVVVCLAFSSQGNEIHAISHRSDKENGRLIMFFQKIGIFQKRKTHGWHHKAPYDTNFLVMTEYLNPLLNKIRFFEFVEWMILKVFRIKVLRGSAIRSGI